MNIHRQTAALAVAVICALTRPLSAFAAKGKGEDTPLNLESGEQARSAASSGGSLFRTFVGLAVVILVIYGVYWVLRQVKASKEESTSGVGLATLATVPLGPGRSLHMVRAGHEVVLVGVADHGVTHIRTYQEDEAKQLGLLQEQGRTPFLQDAKKGSVPEFASVVERLRKLTVRR